MSWREIICFSNSRIYRRLITANVSNWLGCNRWQRLKRNAAVKEKEIIQLQNPAQQLTNKEAVSGAIVLRFDISLRWGWRNGLAELNILLCPVALLWEVGDTPRIYHTAILREITNHTEATNGSWLGNRSDLFQELDFKSLCGSILVFRAIAACCSTTRRNDWDVGMHGGRDLSHRQISSYRAE